MKPLIELIQNLRKDAVPTELREFASDTGGWFQDHLNRLNGKEQRALAQRFLIWFQQEIADAELQAWIASFADEGVEMLTEQVARFCRDFGIDLAWLIDGRLACDPELAAVVKQIVVHYCSACMVALDRHQAIQRFRRFDERHRRQKKPSA